jgi:hypothetical protein
LDDVIQFKKTGFVYLLPLGQQQVALLHWRVEQDTAKSKGEYLIYQHRAGRRQSGSGDDAKQ